MARATSSTFLVLAVGAGAIGCVSSAVASQYRRAHRDCQGEVTVTQRPGTEVFDVVGCGGPATVHRECVPHSHQPCRLAVSTDARRQAAFEFNCPLVRLEETVIADGRIGIAGCGRHAVFVQQGDRWLTSRSGVAEAL